MYYRKHKITDKSIPNAILQSPDFSQDSKMYQDLLEMERKLDWNMMRKKVEVQDALSRTPTVMYMLAAKLVSSFITLTVNANTSYIPQPYGVRAGMANRVRRCSTGKL